MSTYLDLRCPHPQQVSYFVLHLVVILCKSHKNEQKMEILAFRNKISTVKTMICDLFNFSILVRYNLRMAFNPNPNKQANEYTLRDKKCKNEECTLWLISRQGNSHSFDLCFWAANVPNSKSRAYPWAVTLCSFRIWGCAPCSVLVFSFSCRLWACSKESRMQRC